MRMRGWDSRYVIGAILLLAIGIAARWKPWGWVDMWNIATNPNDQESSHVLLVLPIALWLVWVRRERLRRVSPQTSWLGVLAVAAGCLIGYYGEGHGYQSVAHFGAVIVAVGCIVTMLGREVLVNFAPAFAVLIFLIPPPPTFRQAISVPMEHVTAFVTSDVMNVMGFEVMLRGNTLWTNGVPVEIVEACNGLRMVFALILVSYFFAFTVPLRGYVRAIIIAGSPISAVICNVVRLVPTVWIYGHAPKNVGEIFHDVSGWVMLGVSFGLLMAIVGALKWAMIPIAPFTLARD